MKIRFRQIAVLVAVFFHSSLLHGQDQRKLDKTLASAARTFLNILSESQKKETQVPYDDPLRYDWNFTPRARKGITFNAMSEAQRKAGLDLLKAVLSAEGYLKTEQIINLENVLRVVENRPANDSYRDPGNYAFLIFGEPGAEVWGWRFEGHHLSLHFSSVKGTIAFVPGFMGSNPAMVLADVPQKGLRVLKEEMDLALTLVNSFDESQRKKAILEAKAPHEIFTGNARKVSLEKREGLTMAEMSPSQQKDFKKLIEVYLNRYHLTLRNQQWKQLEQRGLEKIAFCWMGDTKLEFGTGLGHYYRIHGPSILIEFDNTQNQGNHIHSVVRDLDNDFGEDLLRMHYERQHR
jgi:hypothetical protein